MTIQFATLQHAKSIADVQERVWPEEESNLGRIEAVLQDDNHVTLVAIVNQQVAGFVDAFETTSATGVLRWEIDLLAVDPAFQGRGLGKQLTLAVTKAGQQRNRMLARGLVAVNNIASQRTFARCGYQSDHVEHGLYIYSDDYAPAQPVIASKKNLIAVSTLRYQGLWVENSWRAEQLKLAQQLKEETQQDVVGAVIPLHQAESVENAIKAGFFFVGCYHWWKLNLK